MRKRTRYKSLLLDLFMTAACLSVAVYFVLTFWKDLNSSARRTDKEAIAIITFKNRIAQRKFNDRVVWERIDKSTPLYNGDLVRTADLAEAVITFNDNSTVNIYENTMIQVYYSEDGGVKIAVDNGNLQVDSSEKGKVSLTMDDGSVINAGSGASLSAKTTKEGSRSVDVKSGSAVLTTEKGETADLGAGESASMNDGGEIQKKPVTVTTIPPQMNLLNVEGGEMPVTIGWNSTDKNIPVVIQTSLKKDFSEIAEQYTVSGANQSVLNVSDGIVYWRVFPQGNEAQATTGKIDVKATQPVTLISPTKDGTFHFRNRNPSLNFKWSENEYAKSYMLVVSSSPDLSSPIVATEVKGTSLTIDTLGNGDWWWQVTPYFELNSIGFAGESAVSSFTVIKTEDIKPPVLSIPVQDAVIAASDIAKINFSWKSEIPATYDLLISKNPDFSNIVFSKQFAAKKALVELPVSESGIADTYYWKIIRNSTDTEDVTPQSEVHSFTVAKFKAEPNRLLYPPEQYSTELSKIKSTQFMWKLATQNASLKSVIQFSDSRSFDSLALETILDKTIVDNLDPGEGNWWWRIGTVGTDGKYSDFTEPHFIEVLRELGTPVIIGLSDNEELITPQGEAIQFKWNPVKGADYYNVRVYDSENRIAAETPDAQGTSIKYTLKEDSYLLRVQAVAEASETSPLRTGPVKTVKFSVRTPSPVVASSPSEGWSTDGLSALRKPVSFTWRDGTDKPASYQFVLKKRQSNGTYKIVENFDTSKRTVSMERLIPGSYTWQIIASTIEGIPVNSKVISFSISEVITLPRPVLTSPQNNLVMNSNYLRKNRSVSFEWNAVNGATEYNFVIYKKDKNGNLSAIYSEKGIRGTKVKIKDLSIFDVGEFVWNVTAFSYAKDGFEEQRSEAASRSFKIDIKIPSAIETVNPGKMYSE